MSGSSQPVVLIVEDERRLAELYAEWLRGEYTVHVASDAEAALSTLDAHGDEIDVAVLDRHVSETDGAAILGRLREHDSDCAVAMMTATDPDPDLLGLDVDERIDKPTDETAFRDRVAWLNERNGVESTVETYLSLAAEKHALESEHDAAQLETHDRYRTVVSELPARRRQIETLLTQVDEAPPGQSSASPSRADAPARTEEAEAAGGPPGDGVTDGAARSHSAAAAEEPTAPPAESDTAPLYRTRALEFYLLWVLALLTYGVGDVVTTLVAVITIPGLIEGNPIVATVLEDYGLSGFLVVKLVVFLLMLSISVQGARTNDRFSYYWPPLVTAGLGLLLTGWNLRLILGL